jgi:hypothetical protein
VLIGFVLRHFLKPHQLKGIRPLTEKTPSVQNALVQGWKLGDRPDEKRYKAVHIGSGTDLIKTCALCGNIVSIEEIVCVKSQFVCNSCFGGKKYKEQFQKPKSPKQTLVGISCCVGGIVLILLGILLWCIWLQQAHSGGDILCATAMAGGVFGLAVPLFKIGIGALTE